MSDGEVWGYWRETEMGTKDGEKLYVCCGCGVVVVEQRRSLHERRGCPNPDYCPDCRERGVHTSHMTYPCPVTERRS